VGKLTERSNRAQTKLISEPHELYRYLVTPCTEVLNMIFVSDDVVWISWQYFSEELVPSVRHTIEIIGAFLTAGARIHLYSYLDRSQNKTICCDTGSVIYVQPADEPPLVETGDKLGAMTSELKSNEINCEVVRLNYHASQLVNFAKMKDMILSSDADEIVNVRTKN
jgi:hypothetical protein